MATTRLMPLHTGKGRTVGQAISAIIDYTENPQKTDGGRLITSWQCDSRIADAEFLFTKNQYIQKTGRVRGEDDVIAYHLRQSFVPGEITPENANRLGCELAKRFTKGNHAYIVCTHIDKAHIHNHVIWNSTALSQTRKFRNFWGSSRAVRRLNDTICIENGYSIVENPKRHGKSYNKWLGDKKKPSHRERICAAIDDALTQKPDSFETLLELLRQAGYEVKGKKVPSLLGGEQKKSIRMDTLGDGYTPADLRAVIAGEKAHTPQKNAAAPVKPEKRSGNLLVDIQAKLRAGKGASYARWATLFNLKQMAQTVAYLQDHELLDYAVLSEKAAAASAHFNELSARIKASETRMAEIAVLKTHIINYAKTRDVYAGYRKAGYSKKYLAEHESDILLHKAAKNAFDELGVKKLPTVKSLQEEYAKLLAQKRRRMPNTGVRAMRCASCCSTSRTWIVCWAKTSARRRRKRSMTGNNGHAPKRFGETRSRTFMCVQRVSGALPLTSRGQFSRRRKLPEKQSGYRFALLAKLSRNRYGCLLSSFPVCLFCSYFSIFLKMSIFCQPEQSSSVRFSQRKPICAAASETSFLSTPISMPCI